MFLVDVCTYLCQFSASYVDYNTFPASGGLYATRGCNGLMLSYFTCMPMATLCSPHWFVCPGLGTPLALNLTFFIILIATILMTAQTKLL